MFASNLDTKVRTSHFWLLWYIYSRKWNFFSADFSDKTQPSSDKLPLWPNQTILNNFEQVVSPLWISLTSSILLQKQNYILYFIQCGCIKWYCCWKVDGRCARKNIEWPCLNRKCSEKQELKNIKTVRNIRCLISFIKWNN